MNNSEINGWNTFSKKGGKLNFVARIFMPELSIAQLVGIYISLLCFVFCILCLSFVYCLIKMSLERPLDESIDFFQEMLRLVNVNRGKGKFRCIWKAWKA